VSLFVSELLTNFYKFQERLGNKISPLIITFLVNDGIAQLKIKATEDILSEYNKIMSEQNSSIILKTLVEILKGEIFVDKDSLTLFFNID
jgi:hypothetical protein